MYDIGEMVVSTGDAVHKSLLFLIDGLSSKNGAILTLFLGFYIILISLTGTYC